MSDSRRSRFVRWLQRTRDRLLGVWNEGPEPPERLAEIVQTFAEQHPHATRGDWIRFTTSQLGEVWTQAWLRGFEHAERDPDTFDPDELATALDPDWRWRPGGITVPDESEEVPDNVDEDVLRDETIKSLMNRRTFDERGQRNPHDR